MFVIFIPGMTWRELRELFSRGFKSYWTNAFNYSDVLQLVLYWLALVFQTLSYVNVSCFCIKKEKTSFSEQKLVHYLTKILSFYMFVVFFWSLSSQGLWHPFTVSCLQSKYTTLNLNEFRTLFLYPSSSF